LENSEQKIVATLKKVLDIMPYAYLPYSSGGQKSIAQFLEYLGKETELSVITVRGNDEAMAASYKLVPMLKCDASRYYDFSLVKKISTFVKEKEIQAIIWEHPYYAWLAFKVRRRTGVKTIFHTHNIEYKRFKSLGKWWWRILRVYEKWCFKKADTLFFIAPEEKQFAINEWAIEAGKCKTISFGVPIKENPVDKNECRNKIAASHNIGQDEKIFLFNGLLGYQPNLDALNYILKEINPLLLKQKDFAYKIIICGKGLPAEMDELKGYNQQNIIYAGFVDDIESYFKAADIFLNPVQSGGGIKTKMVESIAFGTTVVATESGAAGIVREVCGKKLIVVPDNDWHGFADAVLQNAGAKLLTPDAYYKTYFWGEIAKSAEEVL
jgi:polysaccharide biosynthesis protein PslH